MFNARCVVGQLKHAGSCSMDEQWKLAPRVTPKMVALTPLPICGVLQMVA